MVKIREHPIKMDDLGGFTPTFRNIHFSWAKMLNFTARVGNMEG